MKRKTSVAGAVLAGMLLYSGCAGQEKTDLFTIGNETITSADILDLGTYTNGSGIAQNLIIEAMINAETKDEWKDEIKESMDKSYNQMKENEETYLQYLKAQGYESLEAYRDEELEKSAKQFVTIKHYILEKDGLFDSYTPIKVRYLLTEDEEEANAICDKMAEGMPMSDAVGDKEYTDAVLTSKSTEIDPTIIKNMFESEDDKTKTPIKATETSFLVYRVITRDKNELIEEVVSKFMSDQEATNAYITELAEKHNMKLHDDLVYNFLKQDASYILWEEKEEPKEGENTEDTSGYDPSMISDDTVEIPAE